MENSKLPMIALAGTGVSAVVAYVTYKNYQSPSKKKARDSSDTPDENNQDKVEKKSRELKLKELDSLLEKDLFVLGIIKPLLTDDDRYLLCFEDFDRVFRIVQKHAIMRLDIYLERETEKRCNLLKNPDANNFGDLSEEYKKMALSAQQLEI